jgi:phosphatidylethanolamine N-methyltransferase
MSDGAEDSALRQRKPHSGDETPAAAAAASADGANGAENPGNPNNNNNGKKTGLGAIDQLKGSYAFDAAGHKWTMPPTKSPLEANLDFQSWSKTEWMKNSIGVLHVVFALLFCLLRASPDSPYNWLWILNFVVWRLAYNVGIGWLLFQQSREMWVTKQFERVTKGNGALSRFVRAMVHDNMKEDFRDEDYPVSFRSWIAFRVFVDGVLSLDLSSYFAFCIVYFELPGSLWSVGLYIAGAALAGFALWAKVDSYRVVKDFAWYWGDFFFLLHSGAFLIFSPRVPPIVLFFPRIFFRIFFFSDAFCNTIFSGENSGTELTFDRVFMLSPHPMYTIGYAFFYGAALITHSHTVLYVSLMGHLCQLLFLSYVENPHIEKIYPGVITHKDVVEAKEKFKLLYDNQDGYFRRDMIAFKNFNPLRASDLALAILLFYNFMFFAVCVWFNTTVERSGWIKSLFVLHALGWRGVLSGALGMVLHLQSTSKWFVKQFDTPQLAFESWKHLYNMTLVMSYASFTMAAFFFFVSDELPFMFESSARFSWFVTRLVLAAALVGVNVWSSVSTFEVVGDFGTFYGDFFIDPRGVESQLYYTGIYRFVNDPDMTTGFAAFYGLAVLSNSFVMFMVALVAQIANALFIFKVERPHMARMYGQEKVRETSGVAEALKQVWDENLSAIPALQVVEKQVKGVAASAAKVTDFIEEKVGEQVRKRTTSTSPR